MTPLSEEAWIPAFAGMTLLSQCHLNNSHSSPR